MNDYLSKGKEILKMLINNGHEAYFIGEVVRNTIVEKDFKKIDIVTSASFSALKHIFRNYHIDEINDSALEIIYCDYVFFIQIFNIEKSNGKAPLNKHYSKNLLDDLATRDYSINAIAMSHSGKLTDAYGGYEDVLKKRINHIGNAKERFTENPELMLRAFSLVSELNYKLSYKTKKAIQKRRKNLLDTNIGLIVEELKKIFSEQYTKKAIVMFQKTNVDRVIPGLRSGFRALSQHYNQIDFEELLLMAFVRDKKIDDRYLPYVQNDAIFTNIYTLALTNPKAKYDTFTLFGAGLDCCLEANRINYLIGKSRKKEKRIKKAFNALPVKRVCDLAYKGEDILAIINQVDVVHIPSILDDIVSAILNENLENDYAAIENFVLQNLRQKNISYDLNGISKENPVEYDKVANSKNEEIAIKTSPNLDKETFDYEEVYTNHRLDMIEQRLEEQAKQLHEKEMKLLAMENQRLLVNIESIVKQNNEFIQNNDNLRKVIKNQKRFDEELHNFMFEYIKSEADE